MSLTEKPQSSPEREAYYEKITRQDFSALHSPPVGVRPGPRAADGSR
ncbi:hypothetical protein [Billgrantia bachuensis]|nr:hypothetical protein [Halomonas bachuensis]